MSRLLLLLALAGCTAMTTPEDVEVAQKACAARGGWSHVARYERGRHIIINCKDGAHLELRLHDAEKEKP
jgi:hypothetical protein